MAANSSSGVSAPHATNLATFPRERAKKVFSSELFDTYVRRLTRKSIAEQFVDSDHQVLSDEMRLVGESEAALRTHLGSTVPGWGMAWRLCKMVVIQHIRQLVKERLEERDVDEDTRAAALESVYRDDFERLFPPELSDS